MLLHLAPPASESLPSQHASLPALALARSDLLQLVLRRWWFLILVVVPVLVISFPEEEPDDENADDGDGYR